MTDNTPDETTEDETPEVPKVPVLDARPAKTKIPRYMVVGGVFYAQTEDGEVAIKLKFKTGLLRAIPKDAGVEEQFRGLVADRPELLEQLDEIDHAEYTALVFKVVQAYNEKQEALLGE
jgi:hypothetical protein